MRKKERKAPRKKASQSEVQVPTSERLLTTREAARFLRLAEATLITARSVGSMPGLKFCKLGGKVLYDRADLENYIEQSKRTQTA